MAETFAIYRRLAASRIRASYEYRLSFSLQVVGAFALAGLDFVEILVIFHHIHQLAGWSLGEVAFLYGGSYVSFKIADLVMTNMDRLPLYIRMGSFDQVLVRPLSTLGQVLTGDLDVRQVGAALQGVVVFVFALTRVNISWTPARVAVFVSMIVSGFFIYCGIYLVTNAVAFWIMDAREVANSFTYGGNFFTQHPLGLYANWMRRLFGYVVTLAFVNYFPALYILDKDDPLHLPVVLRFLSPVAALGMITAASAVWRLAVRHYRSTGS